MMTIFWLAFIVSALVCALLGAVSRDPRATWIITLGVMIIVGLASVCGLTGEYLWGPDRQVVIDLTVATATTNTGGVAGLIIGAILGVGVDLAIAIRYA